MTSNNWDLYLSCHHGLVDLLHNLSITGLFSSLLEENENLIGLSRRRFIIRRYCSSADRYLRSESIGALISVGGVLIPLAVRNTKLVSNHDYMLHWVKVNATNKMRGRDVQTGAVKIPKGGIYAAMRYIPENNPDWQSSRWSWAPKSDIMIDRNCDGCPVDNPRSERTDLAKETHGLVRFGVSTRTCQSNVCSSL